MKYTVPEGSMYSSKKFLIITGILTGIAYITQFLLSGWVAFLSTTFDFAFFGFVIALMARIFQKSKYPFGPVFARYFLLVGSVTGVFSLILWGGAFVSNTFPGALSKVVLTNSEKTVIYYQMSHIATKRYYDSIRIELEDYAKNGYQLYLEGVLPGAPENQEKLERALGMKISSGTYENIASLMGMTAQDDSLYANIASDSLIHADLSVDDIAANLSTGSVRSENPVDVFSEMNALTKSANPWALSYIFRGLMNASLRYSLSSDGLLDMLDEKTVEALLDKRNRIVVDTFLENDTKNAVFLYGALHFDGMYALLKSKDARWKIESHEPLYPYVP